MFMMSMLLVVSLFSSSCLVNDWMELTSNIPYRHIKNASDIEHEKQVQQYKPKPRPESKSKPEEQHRQESPKNNKTKTTNPVYTSKISADIPNFLKVAGNRFQFIEKNIINKEEGKYTSSNHCSVYTYKDCGNFEDDGFYVDSTGVAKKFVNLLITEYPFELSKNFIINATGDDDVIYAEYTSYSEVWCLNYTGPKSIEKSWIYDKNTNEVYGHVHITRRDRLDHEDGVVREYSIRISDGLTYEDI